MKRLLVTFAIVLSFISFSSFASGGGVSQAAIKSFESSFKTATEVVWTINNDVYKADFNLNGQYISAFYDGDGKMIALTRNINSFQLPIGLQTSLKKKYENFWISDLFEVSNDQGTAYYLTLENADSKVVLKSTGYGWHVYKKQCKQ
jgi:hypothetical protein